MLRMKKAVITKKFCNALEIQDRLAFERNWCAGSINESCSPKLAPQEQLKFHCGAFLSDASALSSLCGNPGALLTKKKDVRHRVKGPLKTSTTS